MKNFSLTEFEYALKHYLSTLCLNDLRVLGRNFGVAEPTKKKKTILTDELVSILVGQSTPIVRNNRGAPVKNDYIDPKILDKIEEIRFRYTSSANAAQENVAAPSMTFPIQAPKAPIIVFSDGSEERDCIGQLEIIDRVPCLLPLNGVLTDGKIHIGVEFIRYYNLQQGDVVHCSVQKQGNIYSVVKIFTINGEDCTLIVRNSFDTENACYPNRKISFLNGGQTSVEAKYFEWLLPIGCGQRGLIIAPPKAGKTRFLLQTAKALASANVELMVLLLEQPPELINVFKTDLPKDSLVATDYNDDASSHVFAAEFILKRAKRYAEMGKDVVLLIDSLSTLAKAYNETDESTGGKMLPCGLESKTVGYLKKYFATAMCSAKGGSITMLCTIACETGNPADDYLTAELAPFANAQIHLNGLLAASRIFPAIDLANSNVQTYDLLFKEKELEQEFFIRREYYPKNGTKKLNAVLLESQSFEEFCQKTK